MVQAPCSIICSYMLIGPQQAVAAAGGGLAHVSCAGTSQWDQGMVGSLCEGSTKGQGVWVEA